jgi:hypothetical protein
MCGREFPAFYFKKFSWGYVQVLVGIPSVSIVLVISCKSIHEDGVD